MLCSSSIRGYYFGGTTMEIKDLEKPVKLTVTIENGKLLHAFLLQCINLDIDVDRQFNTWIKSFLNVRRQSTINEKYAHYLASNKNEIITRTMLREQNFVHQSKFKKYLEDNIEEINDILMSEYNLRLYDYQHPNNSIKAFQLVSLS